MFPDFGYELVAVLADESDATHRDSAFAEIIDRDGISVVFIALPHVQQERISQLVAANRRPDVQFRVVPTSLEMIASQVEPDQLAGIPLLRIRPALDVTPSQIRYKRLFDIALCALGLVVLSPVMAVIAALIKATSHGPVLIQQERVGLNGRFFEMLKFRSMRVDAERTTGPVWTAAQDARRTIIGRLLRRFSLDELPQLWNVIKGDMSLVGPRPERPVFVDEFGDRLPTYRDRHRVRPGLTGWAQVNDLRGMTSVESRLVYDLFYIERWSLTFDMKIVLTTAFRLFTSKNAY
jgi:exopolysaccharide biosynthesis polyprenyl glycosylphosphotransferase